MRMKKKNHAILHAPRRRHRRRRQLLIAFIKNSLAALCGSIGCRLQLKPVIPERITRAITIPKYELCSAGDEIRTRNSMVFFLRFVFAYFPPERALINNCVRVKPTADENMFLRSDTKRTTTVHDDSAPSVKITPTER